MKQKLSIFMGIVFFAAVVTWLSLAEYSAELRNAYDWAFTHNITTQSNIDNARLDGEITRQALAKMMVVYSKDMLYKRPDQSVRCNFKDKDEITEDLKWYAIEACQLWIMGQWEDNFNPMWKVTRAEFWTILSRALWWDMYEGSDPYYLAHLAALEEKWLLDDISDAEETNITRWEVMTALMRSINWIGQSPLLFSEDLEGYYDTYDPEIEYLMTENNLSEKEKEVIRGYIKELNEWLYTKINDAFEFLEEWDEEDIKTTINNADKKIDSIKKDFKDYISDYKNLYGTLNVDLTDTTPYTPGDKFLEVEKFINALNNSLDQSKEMISFVKGIWEEYNYDFETYKEEIEEKYWDQIEELWEKYEILSEEFDDAEDKFYEYLDEYKMLNEYWRAYKDSLIDPEDVNYQPKNAVSISWYLVWEDLTRYQGDVKDQKLEGNWVLTFGNYYYSGEWKDNMPNWFWELQWKDQYYIWNFRNWRYDWYWVYTDKTMTYTWEWVDWYRHWKWEIRTEEYYFSWEWKLDKIVKWEIIYPNWVKYEWGFEYDEFNGQGKLTLVSNDIYEWEFNYWVIDWYGTLRTANWEVYSWNWEGWLLSGQSVLIKDWKVIQSSKIDIIDNKWDNTIIVTDWVDTITMMNKNIWASEEWTWEVSYGSFFKWWNNTEFNSLNTWDSEEFIKASTWEWEEKAQGPCPSWYHIPTENEWDWVITMWHLKNNYKRYEITTDQFYNFLDTFKLPLAGYRSYSTYEDYINNFELMGFTWEEIEQDAKKYANNNYYRWRDEDENEWTYWISWWWQRYYSFDIYSYSGENHNYILSLRNLSVDKKWSSIRCFKD